MNLKTIDGEELETKKETLVYRGKQIKIDKDLPGDEYVLAIEREFGSKLKICINCKYFEYTPLSLDMGRAFKGRCAFREKAAEKSRKAWLFKPKNYDEIQRPDYSIVSIFFCCDNFKLEPYSEEKRKKITEKEEPIFLKSKRNAEDVLEKIAMAVCVLRENGVDLDLLRKFISALRKCGIVKKKTVSPAVKRLLINLFLRWLRTNNFDWSAGNGWMYLFFAYVHTAIAKLLKLNKSAEEITFEIAAHINIYGREKLLSIDKAVEYYSFRMSRALKYLLRVEALKQAGLDRKFKNEAIYRKGQWILKEAEGEMRFFSRGRVAKAKQNPENNKPWGGYLPSRDFTFYLDSEKERPEIEKAMTKQLGAKADSRGNPSLAGNYIEIARDRDYVYGTKKGGGYHYIVYVICIDPFNSLDHQKKLARRLEKFFSKFGKTCLVTDLFVLDL